MQIIPDLLSFSRKQKIHVNLGSIRPLCIADDTDDLIDRWGALGWEHGFNRILFAKCLHDLERAHAPTDFEIATLDILLDLGR